MPGILLHTLTALSYVGVALLLRPNARRHLPLLLAALILHALALRQDLMPQGFLILGFAPMLSLMAWLAIVIYVGESLLIRLDVLLRAALFVAAVLCLLPLAFPAHQIITQTSSLVFDFHILLAVLSYGLFTLAFLHALLMAGMEKQLRLGKLGDLLQRLPSLVSLEVLLFRMVFIAFCLLTLTLITGAVFNEDWHGKPLPWNHKTVFGIISWVVFALLLWGRHYRGWRGRVARSWIISGFVCLLFTYVGTQFALEVFLHQT